MRNIFLVFFCVLFSGALYSQTKLGTGGITKGKEGDFEDEFKDSLYNNRKEINVELDGEVSITDYKIITYERDTFLIDTTLTMKKYYKFNFVRKDDFEYMPFHNQGQQYNNLGYNFLGTSYIPKMGMTAKHVNYKEVEDVVYYHVPTPITELQWRTGLEQGQTLDAKFAMNLSPQLNISFSYKGLRSLGKYRESLVSNGNFRTTFNYFTKNKQYYIRGHFVSHKYRFEENGGLTDESVELFESGDSDYTDRGRLEVNFDDAENRILAKRYHFEHDYKIFKEKDSVKNQSNLKVGHHFSYETKHYEYKQTQNDLLGEAYDNSINDDTGLRTMNNTAFIDIISPYVLGSIKGKASYYYYNHYFNGEVHLSDGSVVDRQLEGDAISVGAEWDAHIGDFNLLADISSIVVGDINGNTLAAAATYATDSVFSVTASIQNVSKSPDFNFLHFQSDYVDYNWQNTNFDNIQTSSLALDFNSVKWFNVSGSIHQIKNYTYFDYDSKPQQANENVAYYKIKAEKTFNFLKYMSLENTIMYQNVTKGTDYLRVPTFVTRNSLYYSNHIFKKKPMYLQTGITFKYFSEYQMNAYDPVLSEFYLQDQDYGGFPMFDFFANARVRTMRIFFTLENITAGFTGRNYYSAPLHPYRDFTVRLGIVWNFFI